MGFRSSPSLKDSNAPRRLRFLLAIFLAVTLVLGLAVTPYQRNSVYPDLYEASISELQTGLSRGDFSSVDLVRAYIDRIEEVNRRGPALHAVLEVSPRALAYAAALDAERTSGFTRGPLHGIPILVKDNIATRFEDGMNTTAGSYALLGSVVPRDAPVVAKLREAGAILLGKAALSEWSHARGRLPMGWSGRGGQCYGAYYPNQSPCGSSSGSGVATSIGLTAASLGTETDGSITCPSALNNIVGIKPTVGLTSRNGVIPISEHQDTVGPMARSVADAAIVLSVIAGKDARDNYTSAQPDFLPDYVAALRKDALQGARIGVPRKLLRSRISDDDEAQFFKSLEWGIQKLKELGATIVDPADLPSSEEFFVSKNESLVTSGDMLQNLNDYFASLLHSPTGVRTVEDLIAFNAKHPDLEGPATYEDQMFLEEILTAKRNASYYEAIAFDKMLGGSNGIDAALKEHNLDALLSIPISWGTSAAAIVGYPVVTVPLSFYPDDTQPVKSDPQWEVFFPAPGIPMGISFIGTAFSEERLIGLAYAFEQGTQVRLTRKAYKQAIPKTQLIDVVGCEWWWICASRQMWFRPLSLVNRLLRSLKE
ncbi:amidase signature enzyme [Exidia glandulosa HHB12029]|uniref:Amidase signature enzyme n=1 Tax=Exidia glandulosa HHB12029 TaxID=1314781 RepID=A0A165EQT4_EXIGL|nr:amidase signature enzyme [Exidia glandulosa HHB12029]